MKTYKINYVSPENANFVLCKLVLASTGYDAFTNFKNENPSYNFLNIENFNEEYNNEKI